MKNDTFTSKQKIAIGYSRISTDETMQKHSLDAQENDIKRYCEFSDLKLKKIEKEMASGKKLDKRVKLKKILEEMKFDVLVVTKIDRLARNIMDLNNIVNELTKAGKEIVFIQNKIDTGSINGTLMLNIFGSFAQFESGMISERVKRGMQQAKEKGIHLGRPRSKTTLEKDEIKQIRLMRQRKGLSYNGIAKVLGYSHGNVIRNKLLRYKQTESHKLEIRRRTNKRRQNNLIKLEVNK